MFTIRTATKQDLPLILAIMNEAILNTTTIYDYHARSLVYVEDWFAQKQTNGYPVFVGEVANQVVAFASYGSFRNWQAYKTTVEHSMYVLPSHQGKGFGKQLLATLIQSAKTQGFHSMIAGIDSTNQASIHLHTKFGFATIGQIDQVAYKFDTWLHLVLMQLILG